ncbi:MAG: DbpA RNA binding domain-containing protein [Bullifex sp.]
MEKEMELDLEGLAAKIKEMAAGVRTDSNPEELDVLRKLIKKNVPFMLRGYFSAYLLRELTRKPQRKERPERAPKKEFRKEAKPVQKEQVAAAAENAAAAQDSAPAPRKQPKVLPEGAKTLYINLGKMGRIYAKDLVELICADTGITRDDIYMVRVHDKYSFVSMSEENCNKAIESLLGKVIRGRTVQINISNREKKEAEPKQAEEPQAESAE